MLAARVTALQTERTPLASRGTTLPPAAKSPGGLQAVKQPARCESQLRKQLRDNSVAVREAIKFNAHHSSLREP